MANPPASVRPKTGPQIKSRPPTGLVQYPTVLISGDEKAGKSLVYVVMSRDPRVGMTYVLDLGEGAADEYAVLPDTQYEVLEHDGSYREILEQVTAVWHEAARAEDAGEPPVVLAVDSVTAEWTMLVNWTNDRARRSKLGQRLLAGDPDAEIDPTPNLWNDATKRHYRLMQLWMTFPGIVVLTARGKEVMVMGENGRPTDATTQKPEGQKGLAYDVDAWIWLTRETRTADLRGVRSLKILDPAKADLPYLELGPWKVLDLATWIFVHLGATTGKRDNLAKLRGDDLEGVLDLVSTAPTEEDLRAIWERTKESLTPQQREDLIVVITARLAALSAPSEGDASLDDHGPQSDAEKLRQAAEEAAVAANDPANDKVDA